MVSNMLEGSSIPIVVDINNNVPVNVADSLRVPVQLDGDDQGDLSSFEASIDPASLRVLVPRKPRPLAWPPRIEWP